MTEPQRRDWPKIIAEIKAAAGITRYKLALMVGRNEGTVKGWEEGCEPKHYDGELLLALHCEYRRNPSSPIGQIENNAA